MLRRRTVVACAAYLGLRAVLGHGHFSPYVYSPIFNSIGYSLVALIAFFLIAYACLRPNAIPTRILRNKLLTTLGAISYGLYVYSWIVLVLIRRIYPSLSDLQAGLIHIAVAIPLSAVLFKYVSVPSPTGEDVWQRGWPRKVMWQRKTMFPTRKGMRSRWKRGIEPA